jgi:hypothetical protein
VTTTGHHGRKRLVVARRLVAIGLPLALGLIALWLVLAPIRLPASGDGKPPSEPAYRCGSIAHRGPDVSTIGDDPCSGALDWRELEAAALTVGALLSTLISVENAVRRRRGPARRAEPTPAR